MKHNWIKLEENDQRNKIALSKMPLGNVLLKCEDGKYYAVHIRVMQQSGKKDFICGGYFSFTMPKITHFKVIEEI